MLSLLLICEQPRLRNELCQLLVAAGHAVEVRAGWQCDEDRSGEDLDCVVVHLGGDPSAAWALAQLTLQRALLPVPLLTVVEEPFPPRLHLAPLPDGIEAVARHALLRHLAALEAGLQTRHAAVSAALVASQLESSTRIHDASDPSTMLALDSWPTVLAVRSVESTVMLPQPPAGPATAPAPSDEPLADGTVLDKYRIESVLGHGTFAYVYRAHNLLLDLPVALKVLKPSLAQSKQVTEHFCNEARNAVRICHPNVVRIHDLTSSGKATYLVMEWIDGVSLSEIIAATGRLHASEVLRVAIAICSALEAAAEADIIHRDIKPANILIDQQGAIKLVDFGLARRLHQPGASVPSDRVVGTPLYMAPEQAFAPDTVDCRSDIYALGATLFHACAGTPPFASQDTLQMLTQHRDQPVPRLCDLAPDCPSDFAGLIESMLAKHPGDRPGSHQELLTILHSMVEDLASRGEVSSNGWSNFYLRPVPLAAATAKASGRGA